MEMDVEDQNQLPDSFIQPYNGPCGAYCIAYVKYIKSNTATFINPMMLYNCCKGGTTLGKQTLGEGISGLYPYEVLAYLQLAQLYGSLYIDENLYQKFKSLMPQIDRGKAAYIKIAEERTRKLGISTFYYSDNNQNFETRAFKIKMVAAIGIGLHWIVLNPVGYPYKYYDPNKGLIENLPKIYKDTGILILVRCD